jgi:peptide/nickel transport system permease protein
MKREARADSRLVTLLVLLNRAVRWFCYARPTSRTATLFAPPSRLHFVDPAAAFTCALRLPHRRQSRIVRRAEEDRSQLIRCGFGSRRPHTVAGISADRHLFAVDEPARVFLFGTDQFGRDVFTRLMFGAQISLIAGVLAAGLALMIGIVSGALAGFYGGWTDDVVMRIAELFLALPWLYLLLAVRSLLPLHIDPARTFLLLVAVIGFVGWARPARLIRGMVLSARQRDHVLAARGFGATDLYLLRRHVLPQTSGVILTQLAVLIPRYVLAEVTLSFFGLGVTEPVPSWGNMLAAVQRYDVMTSYWWMFLPGIALTPVFLLYYALADALHEHTAFLSS